MRRWLYMVLAAVLFIASTACCDIDPSSKEKRMVMLFLAATDNTIHSQAEANISELLTGYIPKKSSESEILLVFLQDRDLASPTGRADAILSRYYTNNSGKVVQEVIHNFGNEFNACEPASFKKVLETAEAAIRPTSRVLLYSSHGTSWIPTNTSILSKTKSAMNAVEWIGLDAPTKTSLDIRDFASVMGTFYWDAILLDCCFMSSVEVAYQLKDCCDYVIASPTEILSLGFPYYRLTENLFKNPGETGLILICKDYYEKYRSNIFGSIALIKSSEMDALADICANIVALQRAEMNTADFSSVQKYGRDLGSDELEHYSDFFFDLAHFFEQFSTSEQYSRMSSQLNRAVPYKASIEKAYQIGPIAHYSGLSCYIPNSRYPSLNDYYKRLAWNQKVKIIE